MKKGICIVSFLIIRCYGMEAESDQGLTGAHRSLGKIMQDCDHNALKTLFKNSEESVQKRYAQRLAKGILEPSFLDKIFHEKYDQRKADSLLTREYSAEMLSNRGNQEGYKEFHYSKFIKVVGTILKKYDQKIDFNKVRSFLFEHKQPLLLIHEKKVADSPIRMIALTDNKRFCSADLYGKNIILNVERDKIVKKSKSLNTTCFEIQEGLKGSFKSFVLDKMQKEIYMSRIFLQKITDPLGYPFQHFFCYLPLILEVNGGAGDIVLLNGKSQEMQRKLHLDQFQTCLVSTDEQFIVVGSVKGAVTLVQTNDLTIFKEFHPSVRAISALDISLDNELIVAGDDQGMVSVWSTDDLSCLAKMSCESTISTVGLSFDNQMLAIGTWNGYIHTLDCRSLAKFMQLQSLVCQENNKNRLALLKSLACIALSYGIYAPEEYSHLSINNTLIHGVLKGLSRQQKKQLRELLQNPSGDDFFIDKPWQKDTEAQNDGDA